MIIGGTPLGGPLRVTTHPSVRLCRLLNVLTYHCPPLQWLAAATGLLCWSVYVVREVCYHLSPQFITTFFLLTYGIEASACVSIFALLNVKDVAPTAGSHVVD